MSSDRTAWKNADIPAPVRGENDAARNLLYCRKYDE